MKSLSATGFSCCKPACIGMEQGSQRNACSVTKGESQNIMIEPGQKLRVFLCHSSEDKTSVRKLYQRLRNDGFAPWLDEEDLIPGQNWQHEISKAVTMCHVVIVCLSQTSINQEGFVQKEIKIALDVADGKPEGTIFIIPARLEKELKVPERLRQWHWVNLFEESGYGKLVHALNARSKELGMTPISQAGQAIVPRSFAGAVISNDKVVAGPGGTAANISMSSMGGLDRPLNDLLSRVEEIADLQRQLITFSKQPQPSTIAPLAYVLISDTKGNKLAQGTVFSRLIMLGRDAENGICLPYRTVGRKHARVEMDPDSITIEDMNSTNGTFVNGDRISTPVKVQYGDQISVGPYLVEFHRHPAEFGSTAVCSTFPEDQKPHQTKSED